jgi:hypothetical protein
MSERQAHNQEQDADAKGATMGLLPEPSDKYDPGYFDRRDRAAARRARIDEATAGMTGAQLLAEALDRLGEEYPALGKVVAGVVIAIGAQCADRCAAERGTFPGRHANGGANADPR